MTPFTSLQLDALRELANIGSGTAGTALSDMLGRSVDISVPNAVVLLVFPVDDGGTLCGMLGVEAGTEDAVSALGEIGNILAASYIGSLGAMTGLDLDLTPPQTVTDMLAAIVASVLATRAAGTDTALILDSELRVEGEECSLSFLLLPEPGGVREILARMGVEA